METSSIPPGNKVGWTFAQFKEFLNTKSTTSFVFAPDKDGLSFRFKSENETWELILFPVINMGITYNGEPPKEGDWIAIFAETYGNDNVIDIEWENGNAQIIYREYGGRINRFIEE